MSITAQCLGSPDGPSAWVEFEQGELRPSTHIPVGQAALVVGIFLAVGAAICFFVPPTILGGSITYGVPALSIAAGVGIILALQVKQASAVADGPLLLIDSQGKTVNLPNHSATLPLQSIRSVELSVTTAKTGAGLLAKRCTILQLIAEANGDVRRFDLIINPTTRGGAPQLRERLAAALGIPSSGPAPRPPRSPR